MKAGARHKQNRIDASEIGFILDLWHSYVMNRAKIESVFDKFDRDHSQALEFDELKGYLTELNEGHAPKVVLPSNHRGAAAPHGHVLSQSHSEAHAREPRLARTAPPST